MTSSTELRIVISICIGVFSLLSIYTVSGQDKYLVLEKMGKKKRIVFYPGEEITFKMKNSDLEIMDRIEDVHDSLIIFVNTYVKPEEIDYIKIERTEGLLSPSNAPKLMIAGVSLFLIDQLNYSVIQGNEYRFDRDILKTSVVLVVGGAIWKSFRYSKFRNKGNRRIRIVVL
jgi:hypothetical protein